MKTISEKLRDVRMRLGYSQEYVSKSLNLGRSAVSQIELGNRKVTAEELTGFCSLYHVSADYLLGSEAVSTKQTIFARGFDELTENDQQEIINLIAFKKAMANQQ